MGGACRRILLVACEPLTFDGADGAMGLSRPVATAQGVIEDVVRQLLEAEVVP
jgi:hydrogenase maturation protease